MTIQLNLEAEFHFTHLIMTFKVILMTGCGITNDHRFVMGEVFGGLGSSWLQPEVLVGLNRRWEVIVDQCENNRRSGRTPAVLVTEEIGMWLIKSYLSAV